MSNDNNQVTRFGNASAFEAPANGEPSVRMSIHGGVLQMQTRPDGSEAPPQEHQEHTPNQMRVNEGPYRHQHGQVQALDNVTRYTAGQDVPQGRGILASARTASGSPATVLTDDTIVDVAGSSISIGAAVRAGFLTTDGRGGYLEPGQTQAQPANVAQHQQHQQQQRPANTQPLIDPGMRQGMAVAFDGIGDMQMLQTLETIAEKGLDAVDWNELSRITGNPAEDMRGFAGYVNQRYHAYALQETGLSEPLFNEFITWATETKPQELDQARRSFIHGLDTSGLKALVSHWGRNTQPTVEWLQKNGYRAWYGPGGREMVEIGGIETEVGAAAKAGLI